MGYIKGVVPLAALAGCAARLLAGFLDFLESLV